MLRRFIQTHPRGLATAGFAVVLAVLTLWLLSPGSRPGTALVRASYEWSQTVIAETALSNAPVVIVYLDLDSYRREGQNPIKPWSRVLHARLLHRFTAAGAKAVVFDILFDEAGADVAADREFN